MCRDKAMWEGNEGNRWVCITGAWLTDWNRCDRKTAGNTNCDRKDIWNLARSNRWRPSHLRPTYRTKWPGLHQRLARVLSVCAPSENLETIKPRLYWSMLRCGDSSLRVQRKQAHSARSPGRAAASKDGEKHGDQVDNSGVTSFFQWLQAQRWFYTYWTSKLRCDSCPHSHCTQRKRNSHKCSRSARAWQPAHVWHGKLHCLREGGSKSNDTVTHGFFNHSSVRGTKCSQSDVKMTAV